MKRVLVTGSSGAGKSVFATALAQKTGLLLIHLDVEFWNPGWAETPKEEWPAKVEAMATLGAHATQTTVTSDRKGRVFLEHT